MSHAPTLKAGLSAEDRKLQAMLAEFQTRLAQDSEPLADTSEAATRARFEDCAEDNERFIGTYLPHYATSPSAAFHADIDAMTSWPARHVFLVHGPREHAKSTRGRAGLLRRLLFGHIHYPLLVSEHLKLSKGHLLYIVAELQANRSIQTDFDIDVVRLDMSEGVAMLRITPHADRRTRFVRIDACSYGTPVKGKLHAQHRPDFVLADEMEDTASSRNPEIGAEKVRWMLQEVYPAVAATAPIIWLGNTGRATSALFQAFLRCFSDEDALRAFLTRGSETGRVARALAQRAGGTRRNGNADVIPGEDAPEATARAEFEAQMGEMSAHSYRARTEIAIPEEQGGGVRVVYAWPERYDPAWYEAKRLTMGPSTFESEENGCPVEEGLFFDAEWFPTYPSGPDGIPEEARHFLWFDPAFGTSKGADYKAVVVVAVSGSAYYVVDAWLRQSEPVSHAIEAIYALFARHAPRLRHGQYENNFGQDDRLRPDFEAAARRRGYPLPISGDPNRGNKEMRIESMEPLFSTCSVLWPEHPNPDVARLKAQLLAYPYGADDGPDALESAIMRLHVRGAAESHVYQTLGERRYAPRRRSNRRR